MYLDGRDIRSELGGAKSASTTSTPKKYFDMQSKPKDSVNVQQDMNELVVEVIANAIDSTEKTEEKNSDMEGVKKINENDDSLAASETKQDVAKEVGDLVLEITEAAINKTSEDVKEQEGGIVLDSNHIEHSIQKTEDKDTSDTLNRICDNNSKTEVLPSEVQHEDSKVEEKMQNVDDSKDDCNPKAELPVDIEHEKSTEKQLNGVYAEVDMQMVSETLEDIVRAAVKGKL